MPWMMPQMPPFGVAGAYQAASDSVSGTTTSATASTTAA
jgi:hypothetical protein